MPAFKPDKLKTNLRLSINRFKLLEKKKSECTPHVSSLSSECCVCVPPERPARMFAATTC